MDFAGCDKVKKPIPYLDFILKRGKKANTHFITQNDKTCTKLNLMTDNTANISAANKVEIAAQNM